MDKKKFEKLKAAIFAATVAARDDQLSNRPPERLRPLTAVMKITGPFSFGLSSFGVYLGNDEVAAFTLSGWRKIPYSEVSYRLHCIASDIVIQILEKDLASIPESWLPPEDCWPSPLEKEFLERLGKAVQWASALLMAGKPDESPFPLPLLTVVMADDDRLPPLPGLFLGNDFFAVRKGGTWKGFHGMNFKKPMIHEVLEMIGVLGTLPSPWIPPERDWPVHDAPTPDQTERFEKRVGTLTKIIRDTNRGTEEPADPELKERVKKLSAVLSGIEHQTGVRRELWVELLEAAGVDPTLIAASAKSGKKPRRPGMVVRAIRIGRAGHELEPALILDEERMAFLDWKDGNPVWTTETQLGLFRPGTVADVERVVAGIDTLPAEWTLEEFPEKTGCPGGSLGR